VADSPRATDLYNPNHPTEVEEKVKRNTSVRIAWARVEGRKVIRAIWPDVKAQHALPAACFIFFDRLALTWSALKNGFGRPLSADVTFYLRYQNTTQSLLENPGQAGPEKYVHVCHQRGGHYPRRSSRGLSWWSAILPIRKHEYGPGNVDTFGVLKLTF